MVDGLRAARPSRRDGLATMPCGGPGFDRPGLLDGLYQVGKGGKPPGEGRGRGKSGRPGPCPIGQFGEGPRRRRGGQRKSAGRRWRPQRRARAARPLARGDPSGAEVAASHGRCLPAGGQLLRQRQGADRRPQRRGIAGQQALFQPGLRPAEQDPHAGLQRDGGR